MSDLTALAARHAEITGDLAQALRELGDTRSRIILDQANAWHNHDHLGVTERREVVKHSVSMLVADTETQLGEIDAMRAELASIELQVKVLRG